MDTPFRLAVDLGTCHTVAVVSRGDGVPRPLLFDGSPLLPSSVYAQGPGDLHVGRDAERMSLVDPARFEPYPKRRVDDGTVLLGDAEITVVELLAAVLRRVVVEARQSGLGELAGVTVLTCPADWGPRRRAVLLAAARSAGLGDVALVDEPIAAATYCERVLGQQVDPGDCLAVFDFGGGTLDLTVVRRDRDGLRVLAVGGLDDLGGVDVDAALVGHLGQLVSIRSPEAWQRLANPGSPAELRDRRAFWAEVRGAKEMLSRAAAAPVPMPGGEGALYLTREELERVAGPLVDRAVDETRRVLERTGVDGRLAGILLVGGSSRIPLVASRLHARFGIAPTVPEQPELPVAYGAMLAAGQQSASRMAGGLPAPARAEEAYDPTSGSLPAAPTSPSGSFGGFPVTPAEGYVPAAFGGPTGLSGSAGVTGPSGLGGPAGPGGPNGLGGPEGFGGPTTFGAEKPGGPGIAPPRAGRPGGFAIRLGLIVAVVLAVLVGSGYLIATTVLKKVPNALGVNAAQGGGDAGTTLNEPVKAITLAGGGNGSAGKGSVAVDGQNVYYADIGNRQTRITAIPAGGGAALWQTTVPIEPTDVHLSVQNGLLIVDGESSATDDGDDVRAVIKLDTHALLWKAVWKDRLDVVYSGTDVVVEVRGFRPASERVDLLTGRTKWSRPGPQSLSLDERRVGAVLTWPAQPAVSAVPPPPDTTGQSAQHAAFRESLGADSSIVVELDSGTGKGSVVETAAAKVRATGDVPLDLTRWTVFDGVIVGKASDKVSPGRDKVVAYRLDTLAKLPWEVPEPAGTSIEVVKPCGQHLVCVAAAPSSGDKLITAYNVSTGAAAWTYKVDSIDDPGWYVLGGHMLYGDAPFAPLTDPVVVGADGKPAHQFGDSTHRYIAQSGDAQRAVLTNATATPSATVVWHVLVVDLSTGKIIGGIDVGKDPPAQTALVGDVLAVVTAEGQVRVAKVPHG